MAKRPDWLEAVLREARVRSGLVVYGNTRDLFWGGASQYLTLPALLSQAIEGVTIRAVWDRVDGLRFANEREAARWGAAVAARMGGNVGGGEAYDVGDEDEPPANSGR